MQLRTTRLGRGFLPGSALDDGAWTWVGQVGSGFTDRTLAELRETLLRLVARADGRIELLEGGRGLPVGVGSDSAYEQDVVELEDGARIAP